VAVASGLMGSARFTGPRWLPHWNAQLKVKPPPRPSQQGQATPPVLHNGGNHLLGTILFWVMIALAVVIVIVILGWVWRYPFRSLRRPRNAEGLVTSAAEPVTEPEPDAPVLRRGIDQALALLQNERNPGNAVIRAWLGLEESAADAGIVRRSAETPTEFTSRVMSRVLSDDRAITTLLGLYLRARFGARPVTAADVAALQGALHELARTWEPTTVGTDRPTTTAAQRA
jgi:hypothetical protein